MNLNNYKVKQMAKTPLIIFAIFGGLVINTRYGPYTIPLSIRVSNPVDLNDAQKEYLTNCGFTYDYLYASYSKELRSYESIDSFSHINNL